MEYSIYLITAVVGCTLLALQIVMMLIGLGTDHDVGDGHDADAGVDAHVDGAGDADGHAVDSHEGHGNMFFKLLSLKALCAFASLFGLTGLALLHEEAVGSAARIGISSAAGVSSFLLVGWIMRSFGKLDSSGTVNLRNAIGKSASVYLRVPGAGDGAGKVTVEIQGRSVELQAVTDGEEIKTGARVMVTDLVGESTLKVVPL